MVESGDEDNNEIGGHRGAENPNSVLDKIADDEDAWSEILDGIENYDSLQAKCEAACGNDDFAEKMFGPKDDRDFIAGQGVWNQLSDSEKKAFVEWMETVPDIKTKFFDVHWPSK